MKYDSVQRDMLHSLFDQFVPGTLQLGMLRNWRHPHQVGIDQLDMLYNLFFVLCFTSFSLGMFDPPEQVGYFTIAACVNNETNTVILEDNAMLYVVR